MCSSHPSSHPTRPELAAALEALAAAQAGLDPNREPSFWSAALLREGGSTRRGAGAARLRLGDQRVVGGSSSRARGCRRATTGQPARHRHVNSPSPPLTLKTVNPKMIKLHSYRSKCPRRVRCGSAFAFSGFGGLRRHLADRRRRGRARPRRRVDRRAPRLPRCRRAQRALHRTRRAASRSGSSG